MPRLDQIYAQNYEQPEQTTLDWIIHNRIIFFLAVLRTRLPTI